MNGDDGSQFPTPSSDSGVSVGVEVAVRAGVRESVVSGTDAAVVDVDLITVVDGDGDTGVVVVRPPDCETIA